MSVVGVVNNIKGNFYMMINLISRYKIKQNIKRIGLFLILKLMLKDLKGETFSSSY